jgi:hypothetical protein
MTNPADAYKEQRDQYVAYALAAADLLIEVDKRWNVIDAIGATKSLLRHYEAGIKGLIITDLFADEDQGTVRRLLNRVRTTGRLDLTRIGLAQGQKQDIFVHMGACFLNDPKGSTSITRFHRPTSSATMIPTCLMPTVFQASPVRPCRTTPARAQAPNSYN